MPAPELVIVQSASDFMLNPNDSSQVNFTITYDISFVPDENALPQQQQATISIPVASFSKANVKAAVEAHIIAAVAGLGGTITASRIFTLADMA